jgi:hypothetical protein
VATARLDQQRGSGVVLSVPRRRLRHGEPQRPRPARQRRLTRRQLSHAAAPALTAASTSLGAAEDTSAKGSPRKGFTAWKPGPEPFALRLGLLTSRTSRWFLSLGSPPTPRFGFQRASAFGIAPPDGIPDDARMAVTLSSYSPALRGKGHLAARVLRRNVALPTERNPGVLVRLPIGGATGRAGRQAPRAPRVGSPRAALRSRAASSGMRGHPSIPSRRHSRPSSAPPRAGRA